MARIARAERNGEIAYGVLDDAGGLALLAPHPFAAYEMTGQHWDAGQFRLLAPSTPSKIVAIGKNYEEHARELGGELPTELIIFLKPPSSLSGPEDPIVLPSGFGPIEHEAELALVIGRRCRHLTPENALDALLGYTCANDVTARKIQERESQWVRAKGFDTFCPVGPVVQTQLDPDDLHIACRVNGEPRQSARTSSSARTVVDLLVQITAVMTLEPGDIVLTGTPPGVGPLRAGDRVEVEIEGVGVLANPVVDEVVGA